MKNFELEVYFSKWEFKARHHLTASDMESMSQADLLAMATNDDRAAFEAGWLGYTQTWGAPELRAEIAATYEALQSDNILCFAGAEEGIYAAMRVLLEPGDHAVVTVPNYQAAETLPLSICDVTGVPLDADKGWMLDLEAVRDAIRPNTKLVSINFPNNPTGAVLPHTTTKALVDLCREHGVWLFSDEVYRGIEADPSDTMLQIADLYERGLSLNVMSKAYGLPGLRIGWIACQDTDLLQRLERYKHYLSICNSAPSERLAVIALKARGQILAKNRALLATNGKLVDAFFAHNERLFEWQPPKGGCVAYPKLTSAMDCDDFCTRLVEESGVLLLPSSIYKSDLLRAPSDRFRIGMGRRGLERGLNAFQDWIDKNHTII